MPSPYVPTHTVPPGSAASASTCTPAPIGIGERRQLLSDSGRRGEEHGDEWSHSQPLGV